MWKGVQPISSMACSRRHNQDQEWHDRQHHIQGHKMSMNCLDSVSCSTHIIHEVNFVAGDRVGLLVTEDIVCDFLAGAQW